MEQPDDSGMKTPIAPSNELHIIAPSTIANSAVERLSTITSEPTSNSRDDATHYQKGMTTPTREETCVICLNPVDSSSRGVASGCLHACYHFGCLATWLKGREESKRTCPLCKHVVEYIKYDFDVGSTKFKKFFIRPNNVGEPRASSRSRNTDDRRHNYSRRREESSVSSPSPDNSILRRGFIYKHRLRSLHIGINRRSRFMNFTPQNVREQAELQSKAKAWIRRELEVFEWTEGNREWLLDYLLSVVKSVQLKAADGTAEKLAEEFFGKDFAGVFIHELHAFLRSPFVRVQDFDNWAQYERPVPKFSQGQVIELESSTDNGRASGERNSPDAE